MKVFCGNVEGTRHREENYINIDIQEVEWVGKDCINLVKDRDSLWATNAIMNHYIE
jgi:hypothetical protein